MSGADETSRAAPGGTHAATQLRAAIDLHQRGLLDAAAAAYRTILLEAPEHADALHMLGVVALQCGRPAEAVESIRRSLAVNPDQPLAHSNAGGALLGLQRHAEALAHLDRALALDPRQVLAHFNRALALSALGQPAAALDAVERALRQRPAYADALNLRGNLLRDLDRPDEALQCYDEALRLRPGFVAAHYNRGNLLQRLGRVEAALASYDAALRHAPSHVEAMNNRAVALLALGRLDEALADSARAVSAAPLHAGAHVNHGNVLLRLRRPTDALASYDRALGIDPLSAVALANRATALLELRRPQEALADAERALAAGAGSHDALNARGAALLALGRAEEALQSFDATLQLDPRAALAHSNRAAALLELRRPEAALAACDAALELRPDEVRALVNRSGALLELDRAEEALHWAGQALRVNDSSAAAMLARSGALAQLKRFDEALAACEQAIALDPQDPTAWSNCGTVMLACGRAESAVKCFDSALALGEATPALLNNRATALTLLQRHDEAAECFGRLLELEPGYPYAAGMRLNARLHQCDWSGYDHEVERIEDAIRRGARADGPFSMLAIPIGPARQLECVRAYTEHVVKPRPPLWRGERYVHDRIRVAYLSADLQDHATAYLMAGLFERHDRTTFETIAVSFGPDTDDAMRRRLRPAFDRFIDVRELTDRDAALLLRELEIDIAVDLKGYTRDSRAGILAFRPAPVQVNYLGFPGTMGADFVDYILADARVIPSGDEPHYAERVVRLPHCYQVTDDRRPIATNPPSRRDAGLPERGFVFCCFNNCYKIAPPVFGAWMRLLLAVPGSVLWLLDGGATAVRNLRRAAADRGVDPDRLVFAGKLPQAEHLARYRLADLFLDTLPYNAHTTASDALWAGLPLVTRTGPTFAGRVATSILHAIGLPELVTSSLGQYEALALGLATNPARLAAVRERVERNRHTHPLFDTDGFRRAIEAAYRTMWERQQRGEPPAAFDVAPA